MAEAKVTLTLTPSELATIQSALKFVKLNREAGREFRTKSADLLDKIS